MRKQSCGIFFLLLGKNILQQKPDPFFFWTGLALGITGFIVVLAHIEEK